VDRSAEDRECRRPYYTKRWAALRREALTRDGYQCQRCKIMLTNGRRSLRSAMVDHIQAHKGDVELFDDLANLQAVAGSATRARSNRRRCWAMMAPSDRTVGR
jgi:5-methylcytosine-specific restriction endonuclease McrA